ncbi:hypothetical protein BWQ96_00632 [Gracilariopsis chorda]|uniref:Secretory immunoglobulin A-binding protein EsiB n=1 Tax=Gracilariopsis chorda TaxID=448386 RepID=A0A2V3J611_9FLOR|nr:hypothetical protein BWQ96_00632 [Gracilariopsis chorda]|eukprot:PXF49562.1 hypothetical protein BWQ96_00632 [Gracilariopsis chorda]
MSFHSPPRTVAEEAELYELDIKEENNIGSMVELALILYDGDIGVPRDRKRAVQLFKRAYKQGYCENALKQLEQYYLYDYDFRDPEREPAVEPYEIALLKSQYSAAEFEVERLEEDIQYGDVYAMVQLAIILGKGKGRVKRDTARAMQLCQRAIKQADYDPAMAYLAKRYSRGTGDGVVKANRSRAKQMYELAMKNGAVKDTVLAYSSLLLKSRRQSEKARGVQLLERLIKQEQCIEATTKLCRVLAYGEYGVPVNAKRAVELCAILVRKKAICGRLIASCAEFLCRGDGGVEASSRRAIKWWKFASRERGDNLARLKLAEIYETGAHGVKRNIVLALALYESVAEEEWSAEWEWGFPSANNRFRHIAAFKLANIVRLGATGVKKDLIRAVMLFEMLLETALRFEAIEGLLEIVTDLAGDRAACRREMGIDNVFDAFQKEESERSFAWAIMREGSGDGRKSRFKCKERKAFVCSLLYEHLIERRGYVDCGLSYMGEAARLYRDGGDGLEANKERGLQVYRKAAEALGSWRRVREMVPRSFLWDDELRAVEMLEWAESEGVGLEYPDGGEGVGAEDADDGGKDEGSRVVFWE